MSVSQRTRDKYNLPPRLFLYTRDQLQEMLIVKDIDVYLHFDGRSVGTPRRDKMLARNIAPAGETPEWRVEEMEFVRWMTYTKIVPVAPHMRY